MAGSLLGYCESVDDPKDIPARLGELNLSGYNPLAIPEINVRIAERFLENRQLAEASNFFQRSLRYYPKPITETRAQLTLASILLAQGSYSASIEHYERALELVERYGISFTGMANVQLHMGLAYLQRSKSEDENGHDDLRRARSSFREAASLDPKGDAGQAARKQLEAID
jgi:tetratricopeptide (TPR) repeat protein